ncbi:MAG: hypothetical protein JWN73_1189 [Betaproteobacteria bacterium]|nr:hypothetical protein [Betaproteobacteria bacterium]
MSLRLPQFAALAFALLSGSAFSQVICSNLSNGTYCDGANGYSSATPLSGGGSTIIRNSDGSRSTINNLDGTTIIRNSDGSRSTINRLDGSTLIRNSDGSHSTVTPLGGGTVIRNSDGSSSTIVPLGNPGYNGFSGGGYNGGGNSGFGNQGTGNAGIGGFNNNNGNSRCSRLGMTTSCD